MSLQPWMIAAGWKKAFFAAYRADPTDPSRYLAVPGCQSIPGRRKATTNFDQMKSLAGQSNQDNLLTSDWLKFPVGYDVRGEDIVRLLGGNEWFTIAGEPTIKTILPRALAYITITLPPRIGEGVWSDLVDGYPPSYLAEY